MSDLPDRELEAAKKLAVVGTNAGDSQLHLARAWFRNNDKTNFYATARTAIEKGGLPVREAFFSIPLFAPWREEEEFKKLQGSIQPVPQTSPLPEKKVLPQKISSPPNGN
jgi:hypothetical protein